MTQTGQTALNQHGLGEPATRWDMEILIGSLLLGGVLVSVVLVIAGLAWQWATTGDLGLDYTIKGMNLFQFVLTDMHQLVSEAVRPRLLINLGIAVLMLTPYVRVLVSLLYFAWVEHNWKYTAFTGFVLSVLTYSLFLR
jgi:uncharacterized membrane protein